jgi:hypothetical protein
MYEYSPPFLWWKLAHSFFQLGAHLLGRLAWTHHFRHVNPAVWAQFHDVGLNVWNVNFT